MLLLSLLLACDSPSPGEWDDGVYHCCAPGEGSTCCGGYEQGMCFADGGVLGECAQAGGNVEGKDICAYCCDGLTRSDGSLPSDEVFEGYPEGCGPGNMPPSLFVCLDCGDGVCDAASGENFCSCEADCPAESR